MVSYYLNNGQAVIDWTATEKKAKKMCINSLMFSIRDCREAGKASQSLENSGHHVSKTQGYYDDERGVYCRELDKRRA